MTCHRPSSRFCVTWPRDTTSPRSPRSVECRSGPSRPSRGVSTASWECAARPWRWPRPAGKACSASRSGRPSDKAMTRKALLIGAQPHDLTGVLNDVDAMATALESRNFKVERLLTPDATRAAILGAYEKLIVDAHTDDAFVIYYSGHGGRAKSPGSPDLQFIVPDDYADSDDSDFRGITGVELSVLLARLTGVAHNTTVIMDCCHAAHMARRLDMRVKALLHPLHWRPTYESIERHVTRLVEDGLSVELRHLVSNPLAVRAVACSPSESAWETANRDG